MAKKSTKRALITGVTGQDGSYLAELLLRKGYEVWGIQRRSSSFNTARIDHIYDKPEYSFKNLYGDLTDSSNLSRIIEKIEPDEIYNLGAQSHVMVSFNMPEYTANVSGIGALRILDAIKETRSKIKFYQASSSEMFGSSSTPSPYNENTAFNPQSPYACAKVFAYYITKHYREAHNIFAANGILFNHETVASFMPMFYKNRGEEKFDLKPISEIVQFDERKKYYQSKKVHHLEVWGRNGWVDVTFASAYPHDVKKDNKNPRFINSRSGAFMATGSHVVFAHNNSEKRVKDIETGDRLKAIELPESPAMSEFPISQEEAELMGMMVGDGSITYSKKGIGLNAKFTNSSDEIRKRFIYLWSKITGGHTAYYPSKSGFNPEKIVGQLRLVNGNDWLRKLDVYNLDRTKRIPKLILNSSQNVMLAFLNGYNNSDGLKKNPCTYEFKNFKTNSATIAMGLWYLIDKTTQQDINLSLEIKEDGRLFYSLNILSTADNALKEKIVRHSISKNLSQREISRRTKISRTFIRKIQKGGSHCTVHHLRKDSLEVKKIIDLPKYSGWFYDLETSSGEFHCGVGKCNVHNSPRRGETFVTRKITQGLTRIKMGLQKRLVLGSLDAKRDWGYAPEYVEAMYLMLQYKKPDDFVVATGEAYSVRDFVEEVARILEIKLGWKGKGVKEKGVDRKTGRVIIEVNSRYFRPSDPAILLGDYSKARKLLGWKPRVKFLELVEKMAKHDYDYIKKHEVV